MPGITRCSRPRPRWPRPSRNSSAGTDRDDRHGQAGHRGGVRPRDLHRWGAVRRPCQAAPRQPGGLGRRGPGPGLAGRARVLAGAPARRRRVGDGQPQLFSSWLGATQIRDPVTPAALGYVRAMMLNMDPPAHSRLRTLLARSFTPRAVARLDERIRGHARALCGRAFAGRGERGECDFAKDVAADLPLLTLADVLGMPEQDRWLLFDWSNR